MIDRAAWRELYRRAGKTQRRGGYPRSWRGVGMVWRDMVTATPTLRGVVDLTLGRGDFRPTAGAPWAR